jgi:hypothetical protein
MVKHEEKLFDWHSTYVKGDTRKGFTCSDEFRMTQETKKFVDYIIKVIEIKVDIRILRIVSRFNLSIPLHCVLHII